eukprot:8133023-Pyramimonas_sp.AAC.1
MLSICSPLGVTNSSSGYTDQDCIAIGQQRAASWMLEQPRWQLYYISGSCLISLHSPGCAKRTTLRAGAYSYDTHSYLTAFAYLYSGRLL